VCKGFTQKRRKKKTTAVQVVQGNPGETTQTKVGKTLAGASVMFKGSIKKKGDRRNASRQTKDECGGRPKWVVNGEDRRQKKRAPSTILNKQTPVFVAERGREKGLDGKTEG